MILPERSYLTRWYTEKFFGLKAANIVCATACQTVAAAVVVIDITVEEMHALGLHHMIRQHRQKWRNK